MVSAPSLHGVLWVISCDLCSSSLFLYPVVAFNFKPPLTFKLLLVLAFSKHLGNFYNFLAPVKSDSNLRFLYKQTILSDMYLVGFQSLLLLLAFAPGTFSTC